MNWFLTILGSIVGSIVLSVFANIITSHIINWYAKRSLVSSSKRIGRLKTEFKLVERHIYTYRALLGFDRLYCWCSFSQCVGLRRIHGMYISI